MANSSLTDLLRHIRQLLVPHQLRTQSDAELLRVFCDHRDQHAFAALLHAHGPMVWRVCRTILRQDEDAEDAFQATFLVLARQAGSIRKAESLPSWLHGVAYRIAMNANKSTVRRIAREAETEPKPTIDPANDASWREVQALLHQEVGRLPEKYRAPFVLCFLEGLSRNEVARRLGINEGTVWSRLAKARQTLQRRLARRGVSLSAVLAAAAIGEGEAPAAVASRLAEPAIQAALEFAAGKSPVGGLISSKVIQLANGRMSSVFLTKLKFTLALVITSAVITSAGLFAHQGFSSSSPQEATVPNQQQADKQTKPPDVAEKKDPEPPNPKSDPLPPGALARLGSERFRHDGGASRFLTFSANGDSIYAAGSDGIIHGWDAKSGRETQKLAVFASRPIGGGPLAISTDGKLAASADPSNVRIWDLNEGKQLRRLRLTSLHPAIEVSFTPDGLSLATLDASGEHPEVSFWSVNSGTLLRKVKLQMPRLDAAPRVEAPKPEQGRGRQARQPTLPTLRNLDFSPDGHVIICKSSDGICYFWHSTGAALLNYPANVRHYAYAPDGRTLAVSSTAGVSLWDRNAGKQQAELPGTRQSEVLAFSPDSKTLAAASAGSMLLWDANTAKPILKIGGLPRSGASEVRLLRFSPDGRLLAGAGAESVIHLWDVSAGKELDLQDGHRGPVTDIAFAPDGRSLLTSAHQDADVRLWQADSGKMLQVFKTRIHARSPHFSADGRNVVAGDLGRYLFIWDAASGGELRQLSFPRDPREKVLQSIESIAIPPDGATVVALSRHDAGRPPAEPSDTDSTLVAIWDLATGKEIVRREDPRESNSQWLLSPDGRLRASFGRGPLCNVHEVSTGKLVAGLDSKGRVLSTVAFSADGQKLAAICSQNISRSLTAIVWEIANGKEIRRIQTGMASTSSIGSTYVSKRLAFSPDGTTLATGAQESGGIQLWELTTGEEIGRFRGYEGTVTSLAFDAHGHRLASGLANGTALVWNVASASKAVNPNVDPRSKEEPSAPLREPRPPEPRSASTANPPAEPKRIAEDSRVRTRELAKEAETLLLKVDDASTRARGLEQVAIVRARIGDSGLAHATFERAKKVIAEMPLDRQSEEGRALAKACAQAGDMTEVRTVLESLPIPKRPSGTRDYRAMVRAECANALAQAGKTSEALELSTATLPVPNPDPAHDRLVGLSATHFALAGDLKKAWALLDSIGDPSAKVAIIAGNISDERWNQDLPVPPGGIALRLDEAGKREDAHKILKQALEFAATIEDSNKQARALASVACCQARVSDLDGATATQEKIPSASKYRSYPLMVIARAQAAAGQGDVARRPIGRLEGAQLQAEGLCQLAAGQVEAGDRRAALASCDKGWDLIQTLPGQYLQIGGNSIVNVRIKAKDYEGAAAVSAAFSAGPNPLTYGLIAANQAQAGDFKAALKTIEDHLSQFGFFKRQDLLRLARVQTEQNQEMEALIWARKLARPEEQAFALLGVTEGLIKRLK